MQTYIFANDSDGSHIIIRTRFWNYRAMSQMRFYILANGYCRRLLFLLFEHRFEILDSCLECSCIFWQMTLAGKERVAGKERASINVTEDNTQGS